MAYSAKILLDSVNPAGVRLTTWELTYPRFIHSELMTHRVFSRNAASSRAIPVSKSILAVGEDLVKPIFWGKNQSGMQAREELTGEDVLTCIGAWKQAAIDAITAADLMNTFGAHKQIVNRVLEPFSWITTLVTATEWDNFYNLRLHPDAQPEFQHLAKLMHKERSFIFNHSRLKPGQWHLPLMPDRRELDFLVQSKVLTEEALILICVGRCARVSYLTHNGERDWQADIELARSLLKSGHMSPFEHVATPRRFGFGKRFCGNFRGWTQYRKTIPNEDVFVAEST